MPYIVGGMIFRQGNLPQPRSVPERHHQVLAPISKTAEGASDGAAKYKAEYLLSAAAGNADEVVDIEYSFFPAELGVACSIMGVPIKYLPAA
jgi:hypothetical protein